MAARDVYVYLHTEQGWVPAGLLRLRIEDGAVVASTFRYGGRATFSTDPAFTA